MLTELVPRISHGEIRFSIAIHVGRNQRPSVDANSIVDALAECAVSHSCQHAYRAVAIHDGKIRISVAIEIAGCNRDGMTSNIEVTSCPETAG